MRYRGDRSVVTILHAAANGENKGVFEGVLAALELELTSDEVTMQLREVYMCARVCFVVGFNPCPQYTAGMTTGNNGKWL